MDLIRISRELAGEVERLTFRPPVTHVYNPLVYARAPHEVYLERWGQGPKPVILLGMNPGPFGMAQTGVPFGDVELVRDWLGIRGKVTKPAVEHPKRPVLGFECPRSEVSGARLWGWARDRFVTPARFFAQFFVVNYCPLAFMEESSKNRTPDKLPAAEREPLFAACDEALRRIVRVLRPEHVIGVGGFAEQRARSALAVSVVGRSPEQRARSALAVSAIGRSPEQPARSALGLEMGRLQRQRARSALAVGCVLHPSPASPLANRGWAEAVERQLAAHGIPLALP